MNAQPTLPGNKRICKIAWILAVLPLSLPVAGTARAELLFSTATMALIAGATAVGGFYANKTLNKKVEHVQSQRRLQKLPTLEPLGDNVFIYRSSPRKWQTLPPGIEEYLPANLVVVGPR